MASASGILGGYLYSSLVPQGGVLSATRSGLMTGTDINSYSTIRAFMNTAEGQSVINAILSGMTDITDESIRGVLLGESSDTIDSTINGIIYKPFAEASGSILGYMLVPDAFSIIKGGMNFQNVVLDNAIFGFMKGQEGWQTIRGLIFRPPAETSSIIGFLPAFDTSDVRIRGLFTEPFDAASGAILGFERGLGIAQSTVNGYMLGILDIVDSQIQGYVSGVLGNSDSNILGYMSAMTAASSGNINGVIPVVGNQQGQILGWIVGWPG